MTAKTGVMSMPDERYHYTECGLDHVFLMNGFEWNASPRGKTIAIKDIDALHRAIGMHLSRHKKDLSGKELRFLRQEMLMSQATLAHLLDVSEQTVHRWEAEKTSCPRAAEALIRRLYLEHGDAADEKLRDVLRRIADREDALDREQQLTFALSSGPRGEWALAA